MLDRIELRRHEQGGSDSRVTADIRHGEVRLDVTVDGKRTKHDVDAARFAEVTRHLDRAAAQPVPSHAENGAPVGYEVILSAGMTQSVFRWVASTPATWEPIAELAEALLALGRELSSGV
jgi:hypothetical protein